MVAGGAFHPAGQRASGCAQVVVGILARCEARLMGMTDMEKMVDFLRAEVPRWPHDRLQVGRPCGFSRGCRSAQGKPACKVITHASAVLCTSQWRTAILPPTSFKRVAHNGESPQVCL